MTKMKLSWNVNAAWRQAGAWTMVTGRVARINVYLIILSLVGSVASAATYYVATNGNDSASGAIGSPWATLEKARSTMSSGDTTYLRGGIYCRTAVFTLTSANSGTTYKAYTGETPVLIGALPVTNWITWNGNILRANVSTQGLASVDFQQLFFNGSRQVLARYPNYVTNNPIYGGWNYVVSGSGSSSFTYNAGDLHTYTNPAEAQIFIFSGDNWGNSIVPISSINASTHTVTLAASTEHYIAVSNRYYIQGVLEELDSPGEWYLDGANKWLYFYPPSQISGSTVYAPTVANIVTIGSGAANITIEGLTLQYCSGAAVTLTSTTNCLIAANTIGPSGSFDQSGIIVNGGFTNGIIGNDIGYVGRAGIGLFGGTTSTLIPANNYADNNYIHDTGVYRKNVEGGGVDLEGVGNRVSRSLICNCPRSAIFLYGQNCMIQSNHMYNLMLETDDGGGIYSTSLDWLESWGSHIENNYIHDGYGWGWVAGESRWDTNTACTAEGIYLDMAVHGVTVNSNIVAFFSGSGIFLGGGSCNRMTNNVLYQNQPRSQGWNETANFQINDYPAGSSDWSAYASSFQSGHDSVNQSIWDAAFPGFTVNPNTLTDLTCFSNNFVWNVIVNSNGYAHAHPQAYLHPWPSKTIFQANVLYWVSSHQSATWWTNGNGGVTLGQWQNLGFDTKSVTSNPLLNGDFSLATNSPASALGIQSLSTNGVGPYNDPLRATWPPGSATIVDRPAPPENLRVVGVP